MNRPLIAALVLGVLATACQGTSVTSPSSMIEVTAQPSATSQTESTPPSPSESLTQTVSARPSPSQTVSASPSAPSSPAAVGLLGAGSIAEVVVDGLRVRGEPGTEAGEAAPGSTDTLAAGTRVYVASGPVTVSGYDWYLVSVDPPVFWQPVGCPTPPGDCRLPALGWVAAGPSDDPWLEAVDPGCPRRPYDFLDIHQLGPLHRLSCLAGETITITGQIAVGGNGWDMPILEAEPSWLGSLVSPVLFGGGSGPQPLMPVRYAPEFGDCLPGAIGPSCQLTQFDNQLVEVDLVIDHPASATCRPVTSTIPVEVAVLRCMAQLVVTAVRTLGAP